MSDSSPFRPSGGGAVQEHAHGCTISPKISWSPRAEGAAAPFHHSSLLKVANETELHVTPAQVKAVEAKTRDQAKSRIWFRMRAGRITASKFKSVCYNDPANPSKSLIMSVSYPEVFRFSNEATKWGCQHEQLALEIYSHRSKHENVKVSRCTLSLEHLQTALWSAHAVGKAYAK